MSEKPSPGDFGAVIGQPGGPYDGKWIWPGYGPGKPFASWEEKAKAIWAYHNELRAWHRGTVASETEEDWEHYRNRWEPRREREMRLVREPENIVVLGSGNGFEDIGGAL